MGQEKLKKKDFFKTLAGFQKTAISETVIEDTTGEPDPLFEKYARKTLGSRQYSERIEVPDPNGPVFARVGNITSGIAPYTGPWTVWEAAHLLRRTSFGVKKADLDALLAMSPAAAVDTLLSISAPTIPTPTPLNYYNATAADSSNIALGASWTSTNLTFAANSNDSTVNYYRQLSLTSWMWGMYLNDAPSIREKMTQFWYHFIPINFEDVRNLQNNSATMCNDYMNLLRTNAMGNFKTLIKAIAKTPAMLLFLGNQYSTASVPNENFARELMELFTLGKVPTQNYTEPDIIAASKVLSGWRVANFNAAYPLVSAFNAAYHNQNNKVFSALFCNSATTTTITNQSGANGANEFDIFFDLLFTRQDVTIAKYVCRRLYRFFVYYDIDANIETNVIAPLATLLVNNGWNIAPVVSTLFKSEHFFDMANKGVMIKSPVDYIAGTLRTLNINTTPAVTATQLANQYTIWNYFQSYALNNLEQGQGLVPNVSGWKAYYQDPTYYQNWINSNSIQRRATLLTSLISGFTTGTLSIKFDAIAFVQQFPTPTIQNPDLLIDAITPYLFTIDLPATFKSDTKRATLLQGQTDNNYWTGAWNTYVGSPTTANANIVRTRLNSLFTTFYNWQNFN